MLRVRKPRIFMSDRHPGGPNHSTRTPDHKPQIRRLRTKACAFFVERLFPSAGDPEPRGSEYPNNKVLGPKIHSVFEP